MALMAPRELGASRNLFRIEIGDHVASLLRHQPRWHEIESARNPKPRPANNWPPQRSESDVTRSAALRVTHFSETHREVTAPFRERSLASATAGPSNGWPLSCGRA